MEPVKYRYLYTHKMEEIYGEEIAQWVDEVFVEIDEIADDACVDNFRACEIGDPIGEDEYEKKLEQGCCGYLDVERTHEQSGRKFRFGLNYGH